MSERLSKEEKLKILRSLEEDTEFRYALAGIIGISEILRKLDRLAENQEKLWLEVKSLRENQEKLWIEVRNLWVEVKNLWIETKSLRENQERILVELRDLRIGFERLTLSLEEEARDVIRHRLKNELNLDLPLDKFWIDGKEINIFGVAEDICIVGEATVRLGIKLLNELEEKVEILRRRNILKAKLIKVIYTDYAVPSALDYAKAHGIWVLKWSGDLTQRIIH
ncbi:hypothetical protein HRbin06_00626 [archaeon HR06]|nr:hypothetical protein HRbin06_00626 [archaeon HR06]